MLSFHYDCQVNHNTLQKFVGGKFWLCEGSFGLSVGTTGGLPCILRERNRRNWIEDMELKAFGSPVERQ
jgi:hypothetical protein